ncbi:hypothetical protein CAPTEDRAFT_227190 [Capitella teleta]|uniref:Mesencephalic astrocyte-derived neurotrophic factor homolog n=1 Tax=Capitella teleta TaxID=283909 RepID=R7TSG7_CAPTE|nr:hypothetical protein CAPTEDRAFT_227190 [Capitella teleta]|eukprot:ELT96552.1 hypothetical protein CAPTEDRAFT_227190 [Capitella teleta]
MSTLKQLVQQTLCVLLVALLAGAQAKKISTVTSDNCEVCLSFMTKFIDGLDSDVKSTPAKIEAEFRKICKSTKKDDNRFCYYVGGLDESATGILGEMSKPVSWGVPAEKVCLKLYRKDEQICELKYDKQLDLKNVDLKKLRVKELKAILTEWDEKCKGCTEKDDYVRLIEELMPRYAPEAHAQRTEL